MTEIETLKRAKLYIEKLAKGINPIDDSVIPDEDVVNHVRLSRCFFYVADVLQQVVDAGGVVTPQKSRKEPFCLPIEKRQMFEYSDAPISVSEMVKRINDLVADENVNKLTVTMVTQWLANIGLLVSEVNAGGKTAKRPSPQGVSIGIGTENRTGPNGPYLAVLYDRDAQQFVLDNLDAVIELYQAKTENQGRPWTPEQDQCLQDRYQKGVAIKEIAATLKRTNGAVRARLKKLAIIK